VASKNPSLFPYAAAALAGFATCLAITLATGKREAWDSSLYFILGIPLMCAVAFWLGYAFPKGAWRWALSMAVGQSVALALGGGSLSLWPLAIVAMTVLSVPQLVVALVGSRLARARG
jgi:hypothetical protein